MCALPIHGQNVIAIKCPHKVPALTLNVYNFFKIQPKAAKLCEFI